MQRLTLILSDLYLPDGGVSGEIPQTLELPALTWLLRFAHRPQPIKGWRHWLLSQAGGQLLETPLASICGYESLSGPELETAWLATPVALEARLDHVRMVDRGLLFLEPAERAAWCVEFNRVFGPQYLLHDCGERAFILSGLKSAAPPIADPARLLGAEIGPALPGPDVPELRRLWTEIEMWLHGAALNHERERAGKRRLAALWLWGRETEPRGSRGGDDRSVKLYGGDPLIAALSRMWRQRPQGAPKALAHIEVAAPHVVAEFAVLTGHPQESLAALDECWFVAARQALESGALSLLEIITNDCCFRVSRRAGWQFWRPRRGWLENLGHSTGNPRA